MNPPPRHLSVNDDDLTVESDIVNDALKERQLGKSKTDDNKA